MFLKLDMEFTPQSMKGQKLSDHGQFMWDASFPQLVRHSDHSLGCHQSLKMGESRKRGQRINEDAILKAEGTESFNRIGLMHQDC